MENWVCLSFGFRLELDLSVGEFHGEFHALAGILLANLFGLLLYEGGEGIEIAGDIFSRLLFRGYQRVVEALDLLAFGLVHVVQCKGLRRRHGGDLGTRRRSMAQTVNRIVLR